MSDKEKIRAEIERRIDNLPPLNPKKTEGADATLLYGIYMSILNFIDSMQEEPVSEDLKQAIHDAMFDLDERKGYTPMLTDMFMAGVLWKKQQMTKDAIEVEVKEDAGGYPYIDKYIEFYDYDQDVPLAKAGDKALIIIKED